MKSSKRRLLALLFAAVSLTGVSLIISSCENLFGGDDLKNIIADEVATATAPSVSVTVRRDPSLNGGTISGEAIRTQKVGIAFPISVNVNDAFGFTGWTDFNATGAVTFADASAPTTTATVSREADNIVIQANFDKRPTVASTDPFNGTTNVGTNKVIKVVFSEAMDPATLVPENLTLTTVSYGDLGIVAPTDILEKFEINLLPDSSSPTAMTLNLKANERMGVTQYIQFTLSKNLSDGNGFSMEKETSIAFITGSSAVAPPTIETLSVKRSDGTTSLGVGNAFNAYPLKFSVKGGTPGGTGQLITKIRIVQVAASDSEGTATTGSGASTETKEMDYSTEPISYAPVNDTSDGYKKLTIQVKDNYDQWSDADEGALVVLFDTVKPTIGSFAIGSGELTNSLSPSVSVGGVSGTGSSIAGYKLTTTAAVPEAWDASAPTLAALAAGDGLKTLYLHVRDAAGNTAYVSDTVTLDQTAPTVNVALDAASFNIANPATTVRFNFSEAVTGFDASDVSVANGSLTAFAGSGASYTATFTASSNTEASGNVISVGSGYADAAGNSGTGGSSANYSIDTKAPTISVGGPSVSYAKQSGTVTFDVGYTGASAVTLGTGNVSLTGTGGASVTSVSTITLNTTYRVTVTAGETEGPVGISIEAGTASDAAGNTAGEGTSASTFRVDNTPPAVSVTDITTNGNAGYAKNGNKITIVFSATDTGANASGLNGTPAVTIGGRTADSVTYDSGTSKWTAEYTIPAGESTLTQGTLNYRITVSDNAGNPQDTGSVTSGIEYDRAAPSVASITMSPTTLTIGSNTATVSFVFSEAVTGFAIGDVTASNGTLDGWVVTDASHYSATFTAAANTEASGNMISVAAASYTDLAGNAGGGSTSGNCVIDTKAPTISVGGPSVSYAKQSGTVTFDVGYTGASAVTLGTGNVSLTGTGGASVTSVSTITLNTTYRVTVTAGAAEGPVGISIEAGTASDAAGNTAGAGMSASTFRVDNTPPAVSVTNITTNGNAGYAKNGNKITIVFSATDTGANASGLNGTPAVTIGGRTADSVTYDSGTSKWTAEYTIPAGEATLTQGTLNYRITVSDNAGNPQDTGSVTSGIEYDRAAPSVTSITMSPTTLTIGSNTATVSFVFSEAVTGFAIGDVTASNGTLDGWVVTDASHYSATFTAAANTEASGNMISVAAASYTDLAGNAGGGSTSGNCVIDTKAPTISVGGPSVSYAKQSGTVTFDVGYTGASAVTLGTGNVSLTGTGGASVTSVSTITLNTTYRVTVTAGAAEGPVGISIEAGTASDAAGNTAGEGTSASTFRVDNTPPAVDTSETYKPSAVKGSGNPVLKIHLSTAEVSGAKYIYYWAGDIAKPSDSSLKTYTIDPAVVDEATEINADLSSISNGTFSFSVADASDNETASRFKMNYADNAYTYGGVGLISASIRTRPTLTGTAAAAAASTAAASSSRNASRSRAAAAFIDTSVSAAAAGASAAFSSAALPVRFSAPDNERSSASAAVPASAMRRSAAAAGAPAKVSARAESPARQERAPSAARLSAVEAERRADEPAAAQSERIAASAAVSDSSFADEVALSVARSAADSAAQSAAQVPSVAAGAPAADAAESVPASPRSPAGPRIPADGTERSPSALPVSADAAPGKRERKSGRVRPYA